LGGRNLVEYKMTKCDAVSSLRPKASFKWNPETDVVSQWSDPDGNTIPSDSEIATEITNLQAAYDAKQYQRNRRAEYPSIEDQLDDIYNNGVDAWKATIKVTKDKYPKP